MSGLALGSRAEPRGGWAVPAGLLAATAVAWLVLGGRMAGMDMGPGGDPGTLGWFAATWTVMTAAMMLPAASPAALRLRRSGGAVATLPFLFGYFLTWMAVGLLGYAAVQAVRAQHIEALSFSRDGRYLAAGAILAAAAYQLTPSKRRRLVRCLQPVLPPRSARTPAALLAGIRHGRCCVACCWTLMAALYALGMMSLTWMALLTVLIAAERVLPRPALSVRAVAAVLALLGVAIAVAPSHVPALTIPHATNMQGMAMKPSR